MTESKEEKTEKRAKDVISSDLIKKVFSAANYCYNCNRCVNVCQKSILGTFSPRSLIMDLTFLPIEEALEKNNIWECLTCGQCTVYCPMTKDNMGVNFPNIIKELRSLVLDYKPLQEQQLECHYKRGYSSLPHLMANDKIKFVNKLGFLEGTGLKITDKGDIAYFLGCIPFLTGIAPCVSGCPAGVDVQGYVSLIAEGKYKEAIDLIREKNPLPFLCGRICTAQCALNCNRQFLDEPVAIKKQHKSIRCLWFRGYVFCNPPLYSAINHNACFQNYRARHYELKQYWFRGK